jgi:hypothetical protein
MRALRVIGTYRLQEVGETRCASAKAISKHSRAGRLELFWEASLPRRSQGLTVRTTRPNQQTPAGIFASTKG